MGFSPQSEDEQAQALTRIVDGTLSDGERSAVEEWASRQPRLGRELASQRRVAQKLRTGGPVVPQRLVAAVEARAAASGRSPRRRSPRGQPAFGFRLRPAIAGAALVALAAVAVGLVVGIGSNSSSPTIPAAARLAFASPTQPAPAIKSPKLLDVSYAGVPFPNYAREFRAVPIGRRVDRIGGRDALTVFYRLPGGRKLSYTVFSGRPVPLPSAARAVVFSGVPLRVFSTHSGLAVVTLVRFGRTCVLAAPTDRDLVLSLAAAPIREQAA
jgi:hypothetical protein